MLHLLYYCPISHVFGRSVPCGTWPIQRCKWRCMGQMQHCNNPYHLKCLNIPTPPPWTFLLFFSFIQCKTMNMSGMFWFLVHMFWFLNILFCFCLCRMGNHKPQKKKQPGRRQSGGRSHQNMRLNWWDEEAMMYAIQEYNSLCVQHGADNVSIKAVAESYQIPTTTFWKR